MKGKAQFASIVAFCSLFEELDRYRRKTDRGGNTTQETALCNAFCGNQQECISSRSLSTHCGNVHDARKILLSTHFGGRSLQNPSRARFKGSLSSPQEGLEERRPKSLCDGPTQSHSSRSRRSGHQRRIYGAGLRVQCKVRHSMPGFERTEPSLLRFGLLTELVSVDAFEFIQKHSEPQKPPLSLV